MKCANSLRAGCALYVVTVLGVASAQAGDHGRPSPPQTPAPGWGAAVPVSGVNTGAAEGCPIETPDGRSLLFASNRPNGVSGSVGNDIWVADRDSIGSPWSEPRDLAAPVNSPFNDFCPMPDAGRQLFFVSERPAGAEDPATCGGGDIYLSRQSPAGDWSKPVMLECAPRGPNFPGAERSPSIVETWFGTFLFYSSTGNGGTHDIYMSEMRRDGSFGPGEVVEDLSTPDYDDLMPNVRLGSDGWLEIVFSSNRPTWGRNQAAAGGQDVYVSRARWPGGPWSAPRNLGTGINTAGGEQRATLSGDGRRLYFGRDGDIYMSERSRAP